MLRPIAFASVALTLLTLTACAKDKEPVPEAPAAAASAAPVAPVVDAAPPPALDASYLAPFARDAGLTPREDDDLAALLSRLYAPCSSVAVSLAQCVAESRACPDCARAARYLALGLHQGWSEVEAVQAFHARFDASGAIDLPVDGSPTQGPASAAVTIVEFGSYVCPHCAHEAPKLDALQKAHPKDVRLVFKPMWSPRDEGQVHATQAALAAARQGKFWEMHALLFANQPKFDVDSLDGYARAVGLDLARFHTDVTAPAVVDQMKRDIGVATTAKVDGLPSIWISGRPFLTFEDLEARVKFEIGEAGAKRAP